LIEDLEVGSIELIPISPNRPHSALGNITPAEFALKSTLEKQAA